MDKHDQVCIDTGVPLHEPIHAYCRRYLEF